MDTQLNVRQRLGLFVFAVAVVGVMACGSYSTTAPYDRQIGIVGGSDSAPPNIVGTWKRDITFIDEYGFVNSVSQTWTFDQFGNAVRNEVTTSETLGVADTVTTSGVWRFDGPLVVINFLQPTAGQLRMDVLVQGDAMTLGGQVYLRVECCATPR
jgi:hypothetical protein